MGIYDADNNLKVAIKLNNYSIIDGVIKLNVTVNEGITSEVGMGEFMMTPEVSLRVHSPIELKLMSGCGYSLKVVYRLPKDHRVLQYTPKVEKSLYDKARVHNFQEVSRV